MAESISFPKESGSFRNEGPAFDPGRILEGVDELKDGAESARGLLAQTSELIEYLPGIAKTAFGNRLCMP